MKITKSVELCDALSQRKLKCHSWTAASSGDLQDRKRSSDFNVQSRGSMFSCHCTPWFTPRATTWSRQLNLVAVIWIPRNRVLADFSDSGQIDDAFPFSFTFVQPDGFWHEFFFYARDLVVLVAWEKEGFVSLTAPLSDHSFVAEILFCWLYSPIWTRRGNSVTWKMIRYNGENRTWAIYWRTW